MHDVHCFVFSLLLFRRYSTGILFAVLVHLCTVWAFPQYHTACPRQAGLPAGSIVPYGAAAVVRIAGHSPSVQIQPPTFVPKVNVGLKSSC